MRVTDSMRYASLQQSQTAASNRLYKAGQQASSGLRVNSPSDDPGAYARITAKDGTIAKLDSRKRSLDRTQGDASIAESALASGSDIMSRAKELAVQMADGSLSASERTIAAKEVTELRQALVAVANTRGSSGYVFGGTKTGAPPIDSTGAFVGNDGSIEVEIGDGVRIRGNASGASAFTASGGRDVLADLDNLATALTTNNVAAVQGSIDDLNQGFQQIVHARTDIGLSMDRMRTASTVTDNVTAAVKQARAPEAELDATTAYTNLAEANSAYERSIAVTQKLLAAFSADKL